MGVRYSRFARITGKWGNAVGEISSEQAARCVMRESDDENDSFECDVPTDDENDIIDLYSVGHESVTQNMCTQGVEVPFKQGIQLYGPKGEIVRVEGLFDGGAMVAAMCTSVFEKVKHRLGTWGPSKRRLRMANGVIVPSQARWRGIINLGGVEAQGEFEVFDSGGGWAFLFGKPLLRAFKARYNFEDDTVTVTGNNGAPTTLGNGIMKRYVGESPESMGMSLTLDMKQWELSLGGSPKQDPPPREVTQSKPRSSERIDCHLPPDTAFREDDWTSLFADVETLERSMRRSEMKEKEEQGNEMGGNDAPPSREVLETSAENPDHDVTDHDAAPVYANQPTEGTGDEDTIFT